MGTTDLPRNELLVPGDLGALGSVLATGGQAEIIELPEYPTRVYKRYLSPALTVVGARDLIAVPTRLSSTDTQRLDEWAAWPRTPVVHSDDRRRLVGLVLPRIPVPFYRPSGDPRDMEVLLCDDNRMRNIPCEPPSWRERLAIALDCAEYVEFVHGLDLVLGDINYRNELWRPGKQPQSFWIDCDSYRIAHTTSSAASITSPGWSDPHSPRASSMDSDRYKLGLLIYRMLVQHPTIEPRPDRVAARLGGKVGAPLFDCAHEMASAGRGDRPEAARWAEALRAELGPTTVRPASQRHVAKQKRPTIVISTPASAARPAIALGPASTASLPSRPTVKVRPTPPPSRRHARRRRWLRRRGPTMATVAVVVALIIGFIVGW
jgi:DNA-binding helix-hairpin-helix protein with protein kinase domain